MLARGKDDGGVDKDRGSEDGCMWVNLRCILLESILVFRKNKVIKKTTSWLKGSRSCNLLKSNSRDIQVYSSY